MRIGYFLESSKGQTRTQQFFFLRELWNFIWQIVKNYLFGLMTEIYDLCTKFVALLQSGRSILQLFIFPYFYFKTLFHNFFISKFFRGNKKFYLKTPKKK